MARMGHGLLRKRILEAKAAGEMIIHEHFIPPQVVPRRVRHPAVGAGLCRWTEHIIN